jgi:lysophospholipase L1-like esterase
VKRSLQLVTSLAVVASAVSFIAQQSLGQGNGGPQPGGPPAAARGPAGGPGRGRAAPPGPPAPVPPEVAMPRPSTDELKQMNDAIAHFVQTDTSPARPVLEKYQSLLTVQPLRPNACIAPVQTPQRQGPRHLAFVEQAKKGDIDLLLEGDSITDWWIGTNGTPTEAYKKYYGNIKTADFAIAGDTTQGVLWGLQNGEGQGFQPKAIMLMIGTNNAGGNTAGEIAEGIGSIILENHKDFPNAKILLLAIFPRSTPNDPVRAKIAEINKTISRLDGKYNVTYMDIGSKFLDDTGVFLPGAFRTDMLHPQEKGYDIWGAAVQDTLAGMLK